MLRRGDGVQTDRGQIISAWAVPTGSYNRIITQSTVRTGSPGLALSWWLEA